MRFLCSQKDYSVPCNVTSFVKVIIINNLFSLYQTTLHEIFGRSRSTFVGKKLLFFMVSVVVLGCDQFFCSLKSFIVFLHFYNLFLKISDIYIKFLFVENFLNVWFTTIRKYMVLKLRICTCLFLILLQLLL